jgi:DNA-binding transcriptional MocR family regulator
MLLYEGLADEFTALIGDGLMQAGERLPSVRTLAQQKRLSVSTVVQALRTLENRGLVEARPQSGYYVRRRGPRLTEPVARQFRVRPVEVGVNRRLLDVLAANEGPGVIGLGSALPGAHLLPAARLNRLYASIVRRKPALLCGSSHAGLNEEALLRAIVHRSVAWGGPIDPAEIVVTNSCSEAMALCLRAVTRPGDTVAVESPTYYVMLQLLESLGLRALEIPTHPRSGVSIEALELATRERQVAACLFVPNGANPLGSVMPDAHKQRVASLLAERGIPLIEDDIYGDLCFTGDRPRPIHAFDPSGNVMLCSSFSKTVSPGLRLGYVAAGRRVAAIALQKTLASGKTNPLTQQVVAELLDSGGFEAHLRGLRRRVRQQMQCVRDAVERYFPPTTRITEPQGGLVLWLELAAGSDLMAMHRAAVGEGIAFVPGELFSASGKYRNCLRLACGLPWSDDVERALKRLGELAGRY